MRLHERAGRDSPGIDERRGRSIVFQQDGEDGVEGKPRGIGADVVKDGLCSGLLHGENGRVHLRDRFNAEAVVDVADRDDAPVGQAQADAEQVRVDVCQIGNVVCILAARHAFAGIVGIVDGTADLVERKRGNHGGSPSRHEQPHGTPPSPPPAMQLAPRWQTVG